MNGPAIKVVARGVGTVTNPPPDNETTAAQPPTTDTERGQREGA